jgi:hypothetical protein
MLVLGMVHGLGWQLHCHPCFPAIHGVQYTIIPTIEPCLEIGYSRDYERLCSCLNEPIGPEFTVL